MAVVSYRYPTLQVVHDNYMRVRQLRQLLKDWIDQRVQELIDDHVPNPEKTLVYYWIKNGTYGGELQEEGHRLQVFPQLSCIQPVGQYALQHDGPLGGNQWGPGCPLMV